MIVLGHQCRRRQRRHTGLAHGDDMRARPHRAQEPHQMFDIRRSRRVRRQTPTSRALSQSVRCTSLSATIMRTVSRRSVAKWPVSGATSSTVGLRRSVSFAKRSSVPNVERLSSAHRQDDGRRPSLHRSRRRAGDGRSAVRLIIPHSAPTACEISGFAVSLIPKAPAAAAQVRIGSMVSAAGLKSAESIGKDRLADRIVAGSF